MASPALERNIRKALSLPAIQYMVRVNQEDIAEAAKIVQTTAKATAPVRTGALRASIAKRVEPNRALVFTGLYYAIYQEPRRRFMRKGVEDAKSYFRRRGYK